MQKKIIISFISFLLLSCNEDKIDQNELKEIIDDKLLSKNLYSIHHYKSNDKITDDVYKIRYYKQTGEVLEKTSVEEYHRNGQLKEIVYYKDGKIDGKNILYYEDGQVEEESYYENGELEGKRIFYYENGQVKQDSYYENGEFENKRFFYNEDGSISSEIDYDNGWRVKAIYYYESGNIEDVRDYTIDGVWTKNSDHFLFLEYYENGNKKRQGIFNGDRRCYVDYEYSNYLVPEGVWTYWYSNGQMEKTGKYSGITSKAIYIKEGVWIYYNKDGSVQKTEEY